MVNILRPSCASHAFIVLSSAPLIIRFLSGLKATQTGEAAAKRSIARFSCLSSRYVNAIALCLVLGLSATAAHAQGLLVVVAPDQPVPLPRPIVQPQQSLADFADVLVI